jgi:hypothetical protein
MIKEIFPSIILEKENLLDVNALQELYDYVLSNGKREDVITSVDLPALQTLRDKIREQAELLNERYNFSKIEVSQRFQSHFYPPGEENSMETHSDDLGDFGRKFISFFYLESEEGAGGSLEFFDPRWLNACWRDQASTIKIYPKTNKLVIFPTFLWHKVNSYHSIHFPRMALDAVIRVS